MDLGEERNQLKCNVCSDSQYRVWNQADQRCEPKNCKTMAALASDVKKHSGVMNCSVCDEGYTLSVNAEMEDVICVEMADYPNCDFTVLINNSSNLRRELKPNQNKGYFRQSTIVCTQCIANFAIRAFDSNVNESGSGDQILDTECVDEGVVEVKEGEEEAEVQKESDKLIYRCTAYTEKLAA